MEDILALIPLSKLKYKQILHLAINIRKYKKNLMTCLLKMEVVL